MRLLVTGGAGFLGSAVVAHASTAGHEAIAASRRLRGSSSGAGRAPYRDLGSSTMCLDITDLKACRAVVRDVAPDVVIHTAFVQTDWATTADGAVNVAPAERVE